MGVDTSKPDRTDLNASDWCSHRQKAIVTRIVAEATALVDRIIEDWARDIWRRHEGRMLDHIGPRELLAADALEKQLMAAIAQLPPVPVDRDPARSQKNDRQQRRRRIRAVPVATWNVGKPANDQVAVAAPASGTAPGDGSPGPQ
jgi:hypothetical protein